MDRKSEAASQAQETFNPLTYFQPVAPAARAGAAWLETLADIGSELTSFVAERIKRDEQNQHELFHCKSVPEVQHLQAKFVQNAINQYHDEVARLVGLAGKMATEMRTKPKLEH